MPSMIDLIEGRTKPEEQEVAAPINTGPSYLFTPSEASSPYMEDFRKAESEYQLPKNILPRIAHQESRFNPEAKSSKGATGLMQIVPKYHPDVDATDPKASINYAGKYLRSLYDKLGSWDLALAAYNAGEGNIKDVPQEKWPAETQAYLKSINQFKQKSMVDLIESGNNGKRVSMIDLIEGMNKEPEPTTTPQQVTPSSEQPTSEPTSTIQGQAMLGLGSGQVAPGGYNELGVPLDKTGQPYIKQNQKNAVENALVDTFKGISTLATHPLETLKGGADFFLSLPGFIVGMGAAASTGAKEVADQVIMGQSLDLEQIYNVMADSVHKASEYFQPAKEMLIGKPTPESQLVGEVVMSPINALSYLGQRVASYEGFKDYPNVRGAAMFAGDIAGLVLGGKIIHSATNRGKFSGDIEGIVNEANKIATQEQNLSNIPDETLRAAQQKVLDVQKQQLDLRAKEVADGFESDALIAEELGRKAEEIAKAKLRPVQDTGLKEATKEQVNKALRPMPKQLQNPDAEFTNKQGNRYVKVGDEWFDEEGVKVTNRFKIRQFEKGNVVEEAKPIEEPKDRSKIEQTVEQPQVEQPQQTSKIDLSESKVRDMNEDLRTVYHSTNASFDEFDNSKMGSQTDHGYYGRGFYFSADKQSSYGNNIFSAHLDIRNPVPPMEISKVFDEVAERLYPGVEDLSHEQATAVELAMGDEFRARGYDGIIAGNEFVVFDADQIHVLGKEEAVKDVDLQTGTPEPESLTTDNSPFRTDPEHTNALTKAYEGRKIDNPEVMTMKLVNDVNRWLNGEEVPIDQVRAGLSEMAARADELRPMFGDDLAAHAQWKDLTSEAAKWARDADRLKNKQTPSVDLNMMVPVDKVPEVVSDVLKATKTKAKDLFRNYDIWNKTGFWKGKDGFWRFYVSDKGSELDVPIELSTDAYRGRQVNTTLGTILKHDKLYDKVPWIKDLPVVIDAKSKGSYFDTVNKFINLNRFDKKVLLHEAQHAIINKVNPESGASYKFESAKEAKAKVMDRMKLIAERSTNQVLRSAAEKAINEMANEPLVSKDQMLDWWWNKAYPMAKEFDPHIPGLGRPIEVTGESYWFHPGEIEARMTERGMAGEFETPWEALDAMLEYEHEQFTYANKLGKDYLKQRMGTKLYTGIDPTEAVNTLIEGAKKLSEYTRQARGLKSFNPIEGAKILRREFARNFLDRSGNIRQGLLDKLGNAGYEVMQKMYLSKGASALSANLLNQMRKEVYGGMTSKEKQVLDNLILADRMIDIGKYKTTKQFKFPEGLDPVSATAYGELFQHIEGLTPERAELIRQRASAYFDWMKKPLKDMLDSQLISQEEYDALSSHNYRRIKLVDIFDKPRGKKGANKITVYDSGVEALAHGRETDIFEPSSEVMALEVFNRAYGRILNNQANLGLLELARGDKTNPFVRVKEAKGDIIPSGWSRIFVMDEGKRKALYLSPEMSKEWIYSDPMMRKELSTFIRLASGSPVLRTFATGINWGFALANLPRDVMHAWFAARQFKDGKWSGVYSPHAPMFGMQIGGDLSRVFSDALNRKGRYEDYIREGGGMEFLVHQGRMFQRGRHLEGPMDKVYNFMGYFGETSEIMTRLAIRDRVIRNRAKEQGLTYEEAAKDKKISQEATFAARDYMDFGQGGGIAKALDNGLPYLNAAIQGTRGMFRAMKPGEGTALSSTYKLAQLAAVTTGIYIAAKQMRPNTMKALENDIRATNNVVIPIGDQFGFEDEHGQMRYPFLMIPLDQSQRFFKKFFEASADKWLGNDVDVAGTAAALKELSPVGISMLPPTLSGTLGYASNKDFWTMDEIWNKTDKPFNWPKSKEEYVPGRTPQAFIDLGKVTGLSPERTKYAVSELVTNGTVWSYLLGQGYDAAFGELPKEQKEMHLAEVLSKVPVVRRFFGITNPYSQFSKTIDKAKEDSDLDRWIQTRGLDRLVEGYLYKGNVEVREIEQYARSFKDKNVYDRLIDRFKFAKEVKNLPNRSFWMRLKGLATDARAKVYVERLNKATDSERAQMMREQAIIGSAGGVFSKDFNQEVIKLRSEQ